MTTLFTAYLAGTQAEMGAQHGKLVADDAKRLLEFYRTMPERALAGDLHGLIGQVGRAAARQVARAWQSRLAKGRPAELEERSRAFMRAVGVPDDALLTLSMMD